MPFWIHIISINLCEQAKKINCLLITIKPFDPSLFRPSINQSFEENNPSFEHTREFFLRKRAYDKELFVHAMPCALFPNQICIFNFLR